MYYLFVSAKHAYQPRQGHLAESGIHLDLKNEHFSRTFSRFSKTIVKLLVGCQKLENLFKRFCKLGGFYLGFSFAAFGTCSSWDSCFLERSELKPCKWHLSDPELIAEALKCKKMLKSQGFSCFRTTWLHDGTRISSLVHVERGDNGFGPA